MAWVSGWQPQAHVNPPTAGASGAMPPNVTNLPIC